MDLNKLRTLVFEKTGIRIDTNDPVFALVALNETVLSECVEQHIADLHDAFKQLSQETAQLLAAGDRAKKLLLQMGQAVEDPGVNASAGKARRVAIPVQRSGPPWPWIAATAGISLLSCVLVLAVQSAIGNSRTTAAPMPSVAAVPAIQAPPPAALTSEQALLIQNGEKYAKMWPKLDPKTQARIQELSR